MNKFRTITIALASLAIVACGQKKEEKKDTVPMTKLENAQTVKQEVPSDYGYVVKIGDKAPTFSTEIAGGGTITPADFEGKVVMLQFTASWCSVCRKEMPHIESDIWAKYKDRKDFMLLGIDKDEKLDKVIEFKEQLGTTYPLVLDPGSKIFEMYAQKKAGVTRNVIINKKGEIVYMTRLFKEEEFEAMKNVIDGLMKE